MNMASLGKNKWQVRVVALVIFLLGAASGYLAPKAYHGWVRHDRMNSRQDRFEQMSERLKLNAEQKTQVQQILGDTREQLKTLRSESEPRVKEIQQQADARLQRVLTPEQWQQFQQMKETMRGRRGRGRRGDDGDPPTDNSR